MKHLTALLLSASLAFPSYAGGPVIPEEPETVQPARKRNALPLILGLLVIGLVVANAGGDDAPEDDEGPCKATFDEC